MKFYPLVYNTLPIPARHFLSIVFANISYTPAQGPPDYNLKEKTEYELYHRTKGFEPENPTKINFNGEPCVLSGISSKLGFRVIVST